LARRSFVQIESMILRGEARRHRLASALRIAPVPEPAKIRRPSSAENIEILLLAFVGGGRVNYSSSGRHHGDAYLRRYNYLRIWHMKTSRVSGFYKQSVDERLQVVKDFADLSKDEIKLMSDINKAVGIETLDRLVENVIGCMTIPLGIAPNFLINGKDYMIPMAIDESSVIAGASNGAKVIRDSGSIISIATEPLMYGQIQVLNVPDPHAAAIRILQQKNDLIEKGNRVDPILVSLGGGIKDIQANVLDTEIGKMIEVMLIIDVRDAMGANAINTIAESLAPLVANITGGRTCLRILSNLADKRLVRATATIKKELIGEDTVQGFINAYNFGAATPYRAVTHNKGIMNGVSALALATGNDFRAIEAGVHSYAARSGRYKPVSVWEKDVDGNLVGSVEFPTAVGIVGGMSKLHPIARISLKILNVKSAIELAEVFGAVGLVQNFAVLRSLVTEGLQRGHMSLHAKNIAMMAGATGEKIEIIAQKMVEEKNIRMDTAQRLLKEMS
jgi:hydroxymethylglutaryl-CoA reductase